MKIDFTTILKDLKGNEIKQQEGENVINFTLGKVAYDSLLASFDGDKDSEKFELFKLARLTLEPNPVEITVEQLAIIKDRIMKGWNTIIVGACFEIIENGISIN